jgi:hypothetical protein
MRPLYEINADLDALLDSIDPGESTDQMRCDMDNYFSEIHGEILCAECVNECRKEA